MKLGGFGDSLCLVVPAVTRFAFYLFRCNTVRPEETAATRSVETKDRTGGGAVLDVGRSSWLELRNVRKGIVGQRVVE